MLQTVSQHSTTDKIFDVWVLPASFCDSCRWQFNRARRSAKKRTEIATKFFRVEKGQWRDVDRREAIQDQ